MICKVQVCQNFEDIINKDSDCVLEFLDLIKLHHFQLLCELKEKSCSVHNLETENLNLNKTIDNLRQEMQVKFSTPVKRKKTSKTPPDSTILSTSKVFPRAVLKLGDSNTTSEDLNIALHSSAGFEESSNVMESSAPPFLIFQSPKKENISPIKERLPLSPLNNEKNSSNITPKKLHIRKKENTPVKLTPTKISQYLPKRIITKETISGKKISIENEKQVLDPKPLASSSLGWFSTDKKKQNSNRGQRQPAMANTNDNLDNSSESIASSQTLVPKQIIRKDRNILSLKTNTKLRQAKLEFDRKRSNCNSPQIADDSRPDDTICDEIVGASPRIAPSIKNQKFGMTQKSLRKISRKNSDDEIFNISIKKSAASTSKDASKSETGFQRYTSPENERRDKIKAEPPTIKKSCAINLFSSVSNKNNFDKPMITEDSIDNLSLDSEKIKANNESKQEKHDLNVINSSSVLILPSQPDDVIIVDETENNYNYDDIDSLDLLEEIMGNDSPMVLKKFENAQLLRKQVLKKSNFNSPLNLSIDSTEKEHELKLETESEWEKINDDDVTNVNTLDLENIFNKQLEEKEEKAEKMDTVPKFSAPITLTSVGHNCDCRNCNSYLRYLISLELSVEEIKRRLTTNTKHAERPLKLHLTPEGFWDPIMRDFPPGDPRNEVIIDKKGTGKNRYKM